MVQDKIRGSLIGGAIGDALGYPVEFCNHKEIMQRYGKDGITRFDLKPHWLHEEKWTGKALVSDDTQMTMFTACGLLNAKLQELTYVDSITKAYLEWLTTQDSDYVLSSDPKCWITNIPEMNHRRAPGQTCLTSLANIVQKRDRPNFSKGCGGIMRVAPIPLFAVVDNRMSIMESDQLAGDVAKITHHHPLGYIPAALMAHIIYRLVIDDRPSRTIFEDNVTEGMAAIRKLYPEDGKYLDQMEQLASQAFALSMNGQHDVENIEQHLGGGWVAEETLAIALYCAHRYFDDFEQAIVASVNHGGDSDSTGAVTGNIFGSVIGYNAIPQYFKDDLELVDTIIKLSDEITEKNIFDCFNG